MNNNIRKNTRLRSTRSKSNLAFVSIKLLYVFLQGKGQIQVTFVLQDSNMGNTKIEKIPSSLGMYAS